MIAGRLRIGLGIVNITDETVFPLHDNKFELLIGSVILLSMADKKDTDRKGGSLEGEKRGGEYL